MPKLAFAGAHVGGCQRAFESCSVKSLYDDKSEKYANAIAAIDALGDEQKYPKVRFINGREIVSESRDLPC